MGESLCSIQPTSMSPFTHLCVVLLAGVAMATTSTEWAKYKLQHSKVYSNEEDARRMYIWKKNVNMVEKHNSEQHSYTMAVNKFSDWTVEEFNNFLGYQPIAEKYNVKTFENVATPDSVDYRNENRVTPVKDQGQCCSCGHMINGWTYIASAGGIQSEESYPYTAHNGHCQFQDDLIVSHISGYEQVSSNEDQMEAALVEIGYP